MDEEGENTYYLDDTNPGMLRDLDLYSSRVDGSIGISHGSYYFPPLLPKEPGADSIRNISQLTYRKGDYDYSELGIGLIVESIDSSIYTIHGFRRSPPILHQS